MRTGRPRAFELTVSPTEREQLAAFASSRALPAGLVRRAQIILRSAEGEANSAIARSLGVSAPLVGLWRTRFRDHGLAGLYDAPRAGRPRTHDDGEVARMLRTVRQSRPRDATHWTVRAVATKTRISKSTVQRYFTLFGVQPHRTKSFKLSPDPFFVEKVRDIVGLYLNPPDQALVLCVEEKSQIQALERTQPNLPLGLGYVEGFTHDDTRHGTTTLFAALDLKSGAVFAQCKRRHRHQEFLAFLADVEVNVPPHLAVHLVVDNYGTHKHRKVKAWLARHPRFHLHFTPTYASWLNQVERWFALITQRAIRRGSFRTVRELIDRIERFVKTYNATARPFRWTATAESIFAKLNRLTQRISGTSQ
ncbi:MAG: IS630 family transposase [Gemmatimonadales bacterium]|nr:IS630 family transposase [Gemmatimonadales bacterium]